MLAVGTSTRTLIALDRTTISGVVKIDVGNGADRTDQVTSTLELGEHVAPGEDAEVADSNEPPGQHVEQEPADEFIGFQCHDLVRIGRVVLVTDTYLPIVYRHEAGVGDGDAVVRVGAPMMRPTAATARGRDRIPHRTALWLQKE